MASRKQKPAPAVVVPDLAPAQPAMTHITNPVTVAGMTPQTRDDIAIRDAVRARLAVIERAITAFVDEKLREGLPPAEIDQLYALELPILFGYHVQAGVCGHRMMLRSWSGVVRTKPRTGNQPPEPRLTRNRRGSGERGSSL